AVDGTRAEGSGEDEAAVPEDAGSSVRRTGAAPAAEGNFVLYAGRQIYDEGAMVSKSAALRGLQRKPFVEMNDEDVKELGLADGDSVVIESDGGRAIATLVIADIARGALFVPYDQKGLSANKLMRGLNSTVTVSRA
ncbi:MAG: hypothetical protein M3238_03105, partial [Actinomycetota bacterium]|nr:hypothetical protein [Actinomycetota bacterium]